MKLIVDRIEDVWAICELVDRTFVSLPVSLLPAGTHEGSVLRVILDQQEEIETVLRVEHKLDRLFRTCEAD